MNHKTNIKISGLSIVKAEFMQEGMSSDEKYHVTLEDGRECLLRISEADQLERKEIEFSMMKMAFEHGVGVSEPYMFGKCDNGGIYQLSEWLCGVDMYSAISGAADCEKQSYANSAALLLKKLHCISEVDSAMRWKERFAEKISIRMSELENRNLVQEDVSDIRTYLINNLCVLDDCVQRFHHGDYNLGNLIILENGQIKAIDFNAYDSWYGEPIFDAAAVLLDNRVDDIFKKRFKEQFLLNSGLKNADNILEYYKAYFRLTGMCEEA